MAPGNATCNPLAVPRDRELLDQFRAGCGLGAGDARQQLVELARAFAAIPYENLTKIVKHAECRTPAASRRAPHEVLGDFLRAGAGGTCFSLTATLLYLVRTMHFAAQPILADRRYGANTHCALIVWIDDRPHLLDPGFLLVDPIPVDQSAATLRVPTCFNQLELVSRERDRLELHTLQQGHRQHRLTFQTKPVDDEVFLQAWDASFGWEMMQYPVVARVTRDEQRYLRGAHFQRRTQTQVQREEIPEQQVLPRIVQEFGISAEVVQRALDITRSPQRIQRPGAHGSQ